MMSLASLTEFLGWCTAINAGLLFATFLAISATRGWVTSIHSKMFRLGESELTAAYFQYMGIYKIAIVVLNLVPYIALKIMD